MLITDRHLYKMDPLKQYKPMKSIPLYNVRISQQQYFYFLPLEFKKNDRSVPDIASSSAEAGKK